LQLQTKQDISDGISTKTYVNKNVIDSNTPYINSKLQFSEKVSHIQYEEIKVAEVIYCKFILGFMNPSILNLSIIICYASGLMIIMLAYRFVIKA